MSKMPWFRTYTEMVDDEKLRLIAFEDRWHFVAILCLKGQGMLDSSDPLLARKVAVKLGIDLRSLEEVVRRLAEVGLIDGATMQPLAWDNRQMRSDVDATNAERQKRYRERKKVAEPDQVEEHNGDGNALHNAPVTPLEEDTDTEEDIDKDKEETTATPAQAQAVRRSPSPGGQAKKKSVVEIPGWLTAETWGMWDRFRKQKGPKTWTLDAKQLSLRTLTKLRDSGNDPTAVIEQSIERGYTGLFPLKTNNANAGRKTPALENFKEKAYVGTDEAAIDWMR